MVHFRPLCIAHVCQHRWEHTHMKRIRKKLWPVVSTYEATAMKAREMIQYKRGAQTEQGMASSRSQ